MGHEVLVDGCFNADPHPGNILYLAETEQLGLIDYGQVKRLGIGLGLGLGLGLGSGLGLGLGLGL